MFKIADYNVMKILGKGAYGIVFLVSKDGVEYALKFQKTLERHIKYNSRSKQWREIIFSCWETLWLVFEPSTGGAFSVDVSWGYGGHPPKFATHAHNCVAIKR